MSQMMNGLQLHPIAHLIKPLYKGIQIEAMLANKFDYENPFMPIQTCLTL